ncbi:MAG TPA: hypothetical protein VFS09_06575 [Candidatus Eisenbacteria bacterium]|nr:hypothetical protein [Candidatus Eisenbacteria bacterium]
MIRRLSVSLLGFLFLSLADAPVGRTAPLPPWHGWERVIGDWVGGNSRGVPGSASSSGFSFRYDLENRVIVRREWADYPARQGRPAFHHEGLMIVSPGEAGTPARATAYDNEGHVIEYDYAVSDSQIVFVSLRKEGLPRFRLTYRFEPDRLAVRFDIAQPGAGDDFQPYVEGTATRAEPAK